MGIEELQGKFSKDFFFSKKIKKEEEELFIMRYKVLTRRIKGLTDSFIVDVKRLKELLLINDKKSYCKFYLIEKEGIMNIGLSFSDNEGNQNLDNDALYILDNYLFIETNLENFDSLVKAFDKNMGQKLIQYTNFTTSLISYHYNTVYNYMTTLEFHFQVDLLKFNMIQFRSTDLNNTSIVTSMGKEDRISFCVHALINNPENKEMMTETIGYDFGTVYP